MDLTVNGALEPAKQRTRQRARQRTRQRTRQMVRKRAMEQAAEQATEQDTQWTIQQGTERFTHRFSINIPMEPIWEFLPEEAKNIIMTELVKLDYRFFSVYHPTYWGYIITTPMYEKVITVDFFKNMIKYNYEHYKSIIPQRVYDRFICSEELKNDDYLEVFMYPEMYLKSYVKDLVIKNYEEPSISHIPVKKLIDKYLYSGLKFNIKHSMDDFATIIKYLSTYITYPETENIDSILEIFIEGVEKYKSFIYYLEYKLITDIFQFRIYIALKIRSLFPRVVYFLLHPNDRFKHDATFLKYFFENIKMTDKMREKIFNLHISECFHFLAWIQFDDHEFRYRMPNIISILNNETDIIEKTLSFKRRLYMLLILKFYHIRTKVFKKSDDEKANFEYEEHLYLQKLNIEELENENGGNLFENNHNKTRKGYLNDFYLYRVLVYAEVFDPYCIRSEIPIFNTRILFDDVYARVVRDHSKFIHYFYNNNNNIDNDSDSDSDNNDSDSDSDNNDSDNNDSDNDSDYDSDYYESPVKRPVKHLEDRLKECLKEQLKKRQRPKKRFEKRLEKRLEKRFIKNIVKRIEKTPTTYTEMNGPVYYYFIWLVFRFMYDEFYECTEKKSYLF